MASGLIRPVPNSGVLAPFHLFIKRLVPFDFWSGPFWVGGQYPQSWVAGLTKGPYQRPPFGRSPLLSDSSDTTTCKITGPILSDPRSLLSVRAFSFAKN